ncbi:MAG: hypothetical protein ABIG11_10625 [bacterium]
MKYYHIIVTIQVQGSKVKKVQQKEFTVQRFRGVQVPGFKGWRGSMVSGSGIEKP